MREPTTETIIAPSGLRYASKPSGSPFAPGYAYAPMSCFRCGAHRPRQQLTYRKLLGKARLVCVGGCPK
jgi:hypothetical protein